MAWGFDEGWPSFQLPTQSVRAPLWSCIDQHGLAHGPIV